MVMLWLIFDKNNDRLYFRQEENDAAKKCKQNVIIVLSKHWLSWVKPLKKTATMLDNLYI